MKKSLFSKIVNSLFVVLILALPHFYLPSWKVFTFEPAKVFLFQAIMTVIFLLFLGSILQGRDLRCPRSDLNFSVQGPTLYTVILFFLWLTISSAFGIDFTTSLWGSIWRRQGLIFWAYGLILVILLKTKFINLKKDKLAFFITLSAFIQALIALYQAINLYLLRLPTPSYAGRITGTFGQPNFLAGFLLISLPFSLFCWRRNSTLGMGGDEAATKDGRTAPSDGAGRTSFGLENSPKVWQKNFFLLAGLLQALIIFLTFSRGSIFALGTMLIFWLAMNPPPAPKALGVSSWGRLLFCLLHPPGRSLGVFAGAKIKGKIDPQYKKNSLLIILLLLIIIPLGVLRFGVKLPTTSLFQNRLNIWKKALLVGLKRPMTGYGLENIGPVLDKVLFQSEKDSWLQTVDRTHNLVLDIFLTSGVVGLFLFGRLLELTFKNLWQKKIFGRYLFLSLVGFLLYGMVNTYSTVHWFFFWLLLGVAS